MVVVMRKYQKGNLVVNWYPEKCTHAGVCVRKLPAVFRPSLRPWINLDNANNADIICTIEKCPSQALTYELVSEEQEK